VIGLAPDPLALQSFAALLLAHVLADFPFQPGWMVRRKRNPFVLLLHGTLVFAFTTALLGGVWQVGLLVALAHLVIDAAKLWLVPARQQDGLAAFLGDQAAHLVTLLAAALWWPGAVAMGTWAVWAGAAAPLALLGAGLILTVSAGGHAVGALTRRFTAEMDAGLGLAAAGRVIGQLERTLIFLLVMIDQPAGIGFLIAAKSVLRFDTQAHQKAGEYVIIGTLASFTWALAMAYATRALVQLALGSP
jgi:hypothetical protein